MSGKVAMLSRVRKKTSLAKISHKLLFLWRRSGFDSPGWAAESWTWPGKREWARYSNRSVWQAVRSTAWCDAHRQWVFAWWMDSHNIWFTQIWTDFYVYMFTNLTISCNRQGIDHPYSIPVPDSQFVRLTVASFSVVSWAIAPRKIVCSVRAELALLVTNGRCLVW